jgi:hypothetical protein
LCWAQHVTYTLDVQLHLHTKLQLLIMAVLNMYEFGNISLSLQCGS